MAGNPEEASDPLIGTLIDRRYRVLKRLGDRGQIERRPDPGDARRAQFYLTGTGQKLNRMRAGTVEAAVQRALSRLSDAKIEVVSEALTALASELGAGDPEEG